MKLGLVTYQMAQEWDVDTIIKRCREAGFAGVELRTSHAHGVEETLTKEDRLAIREKFEGSGIQAFRIARKH